MPLQTIHILSPDQNTPCGGIKKLYRHVDVLNKHGIPAQIVHQQPGFRCTWFANETRVSTGANTAVNRHDFVVVPEVYGPQIGGIVPGIRKVIFNQGCYLTFGGYSFDKRDLTSAYLHPEVVATLVVSEDSRQYLEYAFPKHRVFRIRHSLDTRLFYPPPQKRRLISLMPRRNPQDAAQVINILKFRQALADFEVVLIHDKSEAEAAAILRESVIFLTFSPAEGFGLPPAEAMACGSIVIGYDGRGGKEFFKPEFCYPVETGDIIGFARTVEEVIRGFLSDPAPLLAKGQLAAAYIREHYNSEHEEADIVRIWKAIIGPEAASCT